MHPFRRLDRPFNICLRVQELRIPADKFTEGFLRRKLIRLRRDWEKWRNELWVFAFANSNLVAIRVLFIRHILFDMPLNLIGES